MTRVRLMDPTRDTRDELLSLWNEYYGTTLFTVEQFERLNTDNVLIVEDGDEKVGFAVLLDGGLPYAVLDQLYLRPRYRRFATFRDVFRFVERLCQARGIRWYYGLLDGAGGESERLVDLLKRRAEWNAQYMGEKPMFCRAVSPLASPSLPTGC
jgi:hypothetical protein